MIADPLSREQDTACTQRVTHGYRAGTGMISKSTRRCSCYRHRRRQYVNRLARDLASVKCLAVSDYSGKSISPNYGLTWQLTSEKTIVTLSQFHAIMYGSNVCMSKINRLRRDGFRRQSDDP